MPTFAVHLEYMAIFLLVFIIGTFIWDIDHLFKCNNSLVLKAALNPKEGYHELKELDQVNCRGIFHDPRFAAGFLALALGYFIHFMMDNFI